MPVFGLAGHHRTVEPLLALALLLQQVIAAVAFEGIFARAGLPDPLFGAAVGLHFWHGARIIAGNKALQREKELRKVFGVWFVV